MLLQYAIIVLQMNVQMIALGIQEIQTLIVAAIIVVEMDTDVPRYPQENWPRHAILLA